MNRAAVWMVLLFVPALACAVPAASGFTNLAPGVDLLPGRFTPGTQPDGNSLVLRGKDGLIVFDTGRHVEHTHAIVDFAHAQQRPLRVIVNSHWHLDHIGGNVLLRQVFPRVRVFASNALEAAQRGFLANYRKALPGLMEKTSDPAQKQAWQAEMAIIDAGPRLAPDVVIDRGGERTLAGRKLRLGLEHNAATAGDVWLYDDSTHILASGDLVTLPAPLLDTACPQGWSNALQDLDQVPFTLLVPGHGAPMRHAQFERYRIAYDDLLACAASDRSKEQCEDGWLQDAGELVPAQDREQARGLLYYYLDHSLRADRVHIAKYCKA